MPPPRRRPPPQLRTKSGCFKCRSRRKKCDETRPRCQACVRNDLHCVWPEQQLQLEVTVKSLTSTPQGQTSTEISNTNISHLTQQVLQTRRASRSSVSSGSSIIRVNPADRTFATDDYLLYYFRYRFIPVLLRPQTHPVYTDFSYMCGMAHKGPWARSAYLACGSLHASWDFPTLRPAAIKHYNDAVSSLQSAINNGQLDGSEDSILATILFLYIYEKWNCPIGDQSTAIGTHLGGMARLFQVRMRKEQRRFSSEAGAFYRIAAESFVYQIATLSLYNPDIANLSSVISWADLDPYLSSDPLLDFRESAAPPVLRGQFPLYRLIFEVSSLCQKGALNDKEKSEAIQYYDRELIAMRRTIEESAIDSEDDPEASSSLQNREALLYIIATQLLVLQLLDPGIDVETRRVAELFNIAMEITRELTMTMPPNSFLCWPMMILGYAATRPEDVAFLKTTFLELWRVTYCGQVRRTAAMLEQFWQNRSSNCLTSHLQQHLDKGSACAHHAVDGILTM